MDERMLLEKISILEEQKRLLISLLRENGIAVPVSVCAAEEAPFSGGQVPMETEPVVTLKSPMDEKIGLFMSLFCGRTDVYARQWTKDGRVGYSPVCRNRWNAEICKKPNIQCSECKAACYQPLDEKAIEGHLSGRQVIGIYAMLPGELCRFLAIDLDEASWRDDVQSIREACGEMDIPCSTEVSRSGNGAHIWFFFEEAESAAAARRFGSKILDIAMQKRAGLSFASYDRMFPNQDTMPKGGFGNLIALPLQRKAAKTTGGSLFVDDAFHAFADQWAYLSGVKRVGHEMVARFSEAAHEAGNRAEMLWQNAARTDKEDFREPVEITLADRAYISTRGMTQKGVTALKKLAAFKNPGFYKQQAMRMPVYGIPRTICCAEFKDDYLCMPKGCLSDVCRLIEASGQGVAVTDERQAGKRIKASFNGTLREKQVPALRALAAEENGILSAATAFGKTVVATALIAENSGQHAGSCQQDAAHGAMAGTS